MHPVGVGHTVYNTLDNHQQVSELSKRLLACVKLCPAGPAAAAIATTYQRGCCCCSRV